MRTVEAFVESCRELGCRDQGSENATEIDMDYQHIYGMAQEEEPLYHVYNDDFLSGREQPIEPSHDCMTTDDARSLTEVPRVRRDTGRQTICAINAQRGCLDLRGRG